MDIKLQRKIDRVVGTFLCRVLSLFYRGNNLPKKSYTPGRIAIILLSEMGSLVLMRPMLEYLHARYSHASFYILTFKRNLDVLKVLDLGFIEEIFTVDDRSFSGLLSDSIHTLTKMRRRKIDTVIDCELFSRISSIYSILSGAKLRVGFHPHTQEGLYRGKFINRPVLYNPYNHISQQFITLAKAIESDEIPAVKRFIPVENLKLPEIKIKSNEVEGFRMRFQKDYPQIDGKRWILIYPGGGLLPIRAWPLKNFCTVAKRFVQKGFIVCIIGTDEDKRIAKEIESACHHSFCLDLTGYTRTILELLILFRLSALLITNDGGPGHFAALTKTSSIIFFGPETPKLYGPLDDNSVCMYRPLSCSPCLTAYNHRNSPCNGNNICLKRISTEEVIKKSEEILGITEES